MSKPTEPVAGTVPVWDPLVRLFHWGLVLSIATAWLSAGHSKPLHLWAGYVAAGLLAIRIVWESPGRATPASCTSSATRAWCWAISATSGGAGKRALSATIRPVGR